VKVLVTGSAGFIGSNLFQRCHDEGWDVVGVDDLSNGNLEFLSSELQQAHDCCIYDFTHFLLLEEIKSKRFDVVIHLAALPRVSYSVENPVLTNETNVTKTLTLLDACRGNVKRVVFASSSSVYGGALELPTKETALRNPRSPYALQKAIIEDYLLLYNELYGLDSACLRFFNVFGPNQLGTSPYSCAVSAWMTAIKQDVPLRFDGDGTQTRDMCYVDNVVDACIKAAACPNPLKAERFNIACGDRVSNVDILASLRNRYPNLKVRNAPWRAGDVMHTCADVSKARQAFGYKPLVMFGEGLHRTVRWFEDNWDSKIAEMELSV